ncbi:aspartyl protease family protein [uncultured Brevundimonas sp.]|mgnify:CR=1 FL=1|uniref:aspartyl protease family protein n=1 Tax=uncultured Brevundimonas sp. TaxID=213418 RepID=UPI0030ECB3AE
MEATLNPGPDHDRRAVIAGLCAVTAGWGGQTAAQEPEAPSGPPQIRLLSNLFTRVGAAVTLNNQGPFSFVIDTGAGSTAVADTVAEQLGLPARAPLLVHGIASATLTPSVEVERLAIGGFGFHDLRCPVLPRAHLAADGLLGLDVLDRFRLSFDVVRQTADLSLRGVRVVMGGDADTGSRLTRLTTRSVRGRYGQMILTQTEVDGQRVDSFIDSGAQYSIGNLALRQAIGARRPDRRLQTRPVPVYSVTGQRVLAELGLVQELRLGGSRLGVTPLLFADLHVFETLGLADRPALLIGADLLSRFRLVTLDFPNNRVSLRGLRRQSTRPLDLPNG